MQDIKMKKSRWARFCVHISIASVATFPFCSVLAKEQDSYSLPFIDKIKIYGDFTYVGTSGARVTAAYSYTDHENDPESASRYDWFVIPADNPQLDCIDNDICIRIAEPNFGTADIYPVLALGPNVIGTQINWDISSFENWQDLNGMLLAFCVTPRNQKESGAARCTFSDIPLSDSGTTDIPVAYQLAITPKTGITINSTLLGSYLFADDQLHLENESIFRWKNEQESVVAEGISPGSEVGVDLRLADVDTPGQVIGHRLRFCITPRDTYGNEGSMSCSSLTDVIGGNDNQAPQLSHLRISGDVVTGNTIHGTYQYLDDDMDTEDINAELNSVRWQYRATPSTSWHDIAGSGLSLTVLSTLGEQRFCMTPYATTGTIAGTEMCSPARTIMNTLPNELSILRNRYASQVSDCGSDSAPAFLCSGLLAKGALPGQYAWGTADSNAVSFNYLRSDANFSHLSNGETHGMIFLPVIGTGDDNRPDQFEIYCAFPVTADTEQRNDKGCGQHTTFGSTSDYCYPQGITNLSAWRDHFKSVAANSQQAHQCGFDVHDYINDGSAEHFMLSLRARNDVISNFLATPNELRVESWRNSSLSEIPIEAFFYSDLAGLNDAQRDQSEYFDTTGIRLPLIFVSLPTNSFSYTQLYYYADEQAVLY